MTRILFVILSIFLYPHSVLADDIRSKVAGSDIPGMKINQIDPENHVYGIPWSSSEDVFIETWGDPTGYIRFNAQETAMIYGKRHMFIFSNDRLSGLRITHNILDWQVSKKIPPNPIFDTIQWQLSNGIKEDSNLAEVKGVLGKSLNNKKYERSYETANAKVILNFSHYTDAGETDQAYKLHGIMIERKQM